jgi:hypothetical protein
MSTQRIRQTGRRRTQLAQLTAIIELMCECGGPCDETYEIKHDEYKALGPPETRPAIRSPKCGNRLLDGEVVIRRGPRFVLVGVELPTIDELPPPALSDDLAEQIDANEQLDELIASIEAGMNRCERHLGRLDVLLAEQRAGIERLEARYRGEEL